MVGLVTLGLTTPTGQRLLTAAAIRKGEAISRENQHQLCASGTTTFAAFFAARSAITTPIRPTSSTPLGG